MNDLAFTKKPLPCSCGGKRIFAEMLVPDGVFGKPAAVILSHGYNSSHSDMNDTAEALAKNGFLAVYYDFRGGSVRSLSEGSSLEMSIMTEQDDLRAVLEALKQTGLADNDRIYLYGESQGGFVSALEMAKPENSVAGAVLVYPAFCIPSDWIDRKPEECTLMGMKLSAKFREELPEYDVFEHISVFGKPVLIFHGDADGLVSLEYSRKVNKALKNSRLEIFPGEGHGFSPGTREKMNRLIVDFLNK